MPKPYSEDLRSRVAEAVAAGHTVRAVALQYKVSPAFVCRMHALWRETGAVQGKAFGGYRRSRLEPYEAAIKEQLANSPSITLKELQSWLEHEQALSVSISAIDKFIRHKLGYRYKKKRWPPVSSSARMSSGPESNGKPGSKPAIFRSWCFWMKRASPRI